MALDFLYFAGYPRYQFPAFVAPSSRDNAVCVQGGAGGLSVWLVDLDLGSYPGWWAAAVAA